MPASSTNSSLPVLAKNNKNPATTHGLSKRAKDGSQTSRAPAIHKQKQEVVPSNSMAPLTARNKHTHSSTTTTTTNATATTTPKEAQPPANAKPDNAVSSTRRTAAVAKAMTPAEVITTMSDQLTPFEHSEVLEYQQIYFVGNTGAKKIKGIPHTRNNNGYDDDRGDYKLVVGDHLEFRYEVLAFLGKGSFGQVVRAIDHKKKTTVALKIIRNKKRFHHQALVEVKILEHLMNHDKEHKSGIVRVYGYFYFRNHLCITFECCSYNLYEFIKNNNFKGFSLGLIRRFAIQLLTSLVYIGKHKIIHCDMKPENILLKAPNKSTIKLIDFGSSCFENERVYTYIQSRFYRSPEVIMGLPYGMEIDMWSFGCILSELYTGYPIFPGENEAEQMACMMEVLGLPPKKMISASTRRKTFFDSDYNPIIVPNSRGKLRTPNAKNLETVTQCNDPLFISFLAKCLKWDPKHRLTPHMAFEHPWISETLKKTIETSREAARGERSQRHRERGALTHRADKYGKQPASDRAMFPTIKGVGGDKKRR
eukprot:CAMPEP_0175096354 /NCGR_PEP_ID=MMETSP0086_2-20121207/4686_1 /TAXON_ID=136419 /ORGANISM="Unknown Unknown, Strain D1" /LENGTH=535 /DNA_ID=CAMNT_0016369747 /DNA_START=17 /DNA_END=1624 /DNA_ORIENTATION=-